MAKVDYEKQQFIEQKETNFVLWVNTVATIITGISTLILSYLALRQ